MASTRHIISLTLFLTMSAFVGCDSSDNGNPVDPVNEQHIWVHHAGDSVKVPLNSLPGFDADGEKAVQLSLLIDTNLISPYRDKNGTAYESRRLYSYQVVADDGFSASTGRGYPNNIWSHFLLGHIMRATRKVIFPDSKIDLPGAYDVKEARHIFVRRKIDVDLIDSVVFKELDKMTPVSVQNPDGNMELAVRLADLIPNAVTDPAQRMYNLAALDGYGPAEDMTWGQFQTGYWLLTTKKTMFTDVSLVGGRYKLAVLEKIIIRK